VGTCPAGPAFSTGGETAQRPLRRRNRTQGAAMVDFHKRTTSFSTTGLILLAVVIVLVLVALFFRP